MFLFRVVFCIFLANQLASAQEKVTFSEHIAPILYENCTYCHRSGQSAPFVLYEYKDARRRSRTIARVVKDRYMPPWMPQGGDIPFKGDRRLSQKEIDLITTWVDQGCEEGDPSLKPPTPTFPSEKWNLGEPDLIVKMGEPYALPAEGPDIYKDFNMPYKVNEKKYIKAMAFLPGNLSVVHHSLVYLEGVGQEKQFIGGWVPGAKGMYLPKGLSYEMNPEGKVSLSTHFHLSGKPETEVSSVGLYFDDKPPEREMAAVMLPPHFGIFTGLNIAAGDPQTELTDSFMLPVDAEAFWVYGHIHYLGRKVRLTATLPDGETIKLLNIPDWDFNWQETYEFEEHVFLPKGTVLTSYFLWDNSENNPDNPFSPPKQVTWGKESFDEMAELDLFLILKSKEDKEILKKAYNRHIAKPWFDHMASQEMLKFADDTIKKAMKKFDMDGNGFLDEAEKLSAQNNLKQPVSIK